jgi:heme-degrading monooxygenase HmoA
MIYEMRFQTVDPARRADYVKVYRQAVQGCKAAGSTGGHILCSDDDPSAVIVILRWESKEHLARWRGTPSYNSFPAAVEGLQTKKPHGGFYVAETI